MSAKITIPEALKADMPEGRWGKILAATPIVMTVIATLLAGLSSGEMTRAQYDRSLAAQQQSKAGDQWNYFQAKRLRAALQRNTLDLLRGTATVRSLDGAAVQQRFAGTPAGAALEADGGRSALAAHVQGTIPLPGHDGAVNQKINDALAAMETGRDERDISALVASITEAELGAALRNANDRVREFDATLKPLNQAIDAMEKEFGHTPAGEPDQLARDFVVARLVYAAQRYDAESRQNQLIAQLYELQVRKSNLSAERHHKRSQRFFYGMLAAQMGVIMATFSMAARKHNFLWALAATAGTAALGFAAYVYLFV